MIIKIKKATAITTRTHNGIPGESCFNARTPESGSLARGGLICINQA
jgi:hypothetical protein